jgi:hypothetical protein
MQGFFLAYYRQHVRRQRVQPCVPVRPLPAFYGQGFFAVQEGKGLEFVFQTFPWVINGMIILCSSVVLSTTSCLFQDPEQVNLCGRTSEVDDSPRVPLLLQNHAVLWKTCSQCIENQ